MRDRVWITWERQRRNIGICTALGWDFHELIYDDNHKMVRYLKSIYKTIAILSLRKPKFVCVQNPSIVLPFLVLFLRIFFNYKVLIDAHNSGIYPLEGSSSFLMFVSRLYQKNADLTFVTNDSLKKVVESNYGKAFVLPDKIPVRLTSQKPSAHLSGKINIAYICTFEDIHILVTGRYEGKVDSNKLPVNVQLLGFVSEEEYWALLASVDVIADLTIREDCLVCGAYEGVAVTKPLILSDTKILKSYFNKGCIYVEPSASSIAKGILTAVEQQNQLKRQVKELKNSLIEDWENRLQNLKKIIRSL